MTRTIGPHSSTLPDFGNQKSPLREPILNMAVEPCLDYPRMSRLPKQIPLATLTA
jgi:hypothetical protein